MKTILKDLARGPGGETDTGPDGFGSEPDAGWDSASGFDPGFQAGPLNVAASFADPLFVGAAPGNDWQGPFGSLDPLGPDPGPISPTDVSWISGADTSGGAPSPSATAVNSGFHINLLYDAAAMAAPQSFRDGIQTAMNLLSAAISDNITVNIKIDYSGTGGGASAGPDNGQYLSYSTVRNDLITKATPGDTTFNSLPNTTSIQTQSQVAVWNAQLKLFGNMSANDTTTDDGSANFSTDINPNLLPGVALHELTHALGRIPYGSQPDIFDLFRFTSPGTRLFSGGATAPAAYFSLDGGNTKIADYGRNSDPSDFLNSGVQGSTDPFNEFYSSNTLQQLTAIDLRQLDALGFHIASTIDGTAGNDLFVAISGSHTYNGEGGSNTISYASSPAGVNVDLPAGSASNGWGGHDTLINIQSVTGSNYNDVLHGNGANGQLTGGGGNDVITGGGSSDTADYSGTHSAYSFSYTPGSAVWTVVDQRSGSPDGSDVLVQLQNILFSDGHGTLSHTATSAELDIQLTNGGSATFLQDLTGSQTWTSYTNNFDGQANLTTQDGSYANGGSWHGAWDVAGTQPWTSYTANYDHNGNQTLQVGNYDDGSHWVQTWDVAATQNWSSYTNSYDAAWNLTSQVGNYDNGQHWTAAWDVGNTQSWSSYTNNYDASWNLLAQYMNNDDGTHTVTQWQNGTAQVSHYNASWQAIA